MTYRLAGSGEDKDLSLLEPEAGRLEELHNVLWLQEVMATEGSRAAVNASRGL